MIKKGVKNMTKYKIIACTTRDITDEISSSAVDIDNLRGDPEHYKYIEEQPYTRNLAVILEIRRQMKD